MSDIYANAHITLIASSASSDKIGFLAERPPAYTGIRINSNENSDQLDMRVQKLMYHGDPQTLRAKPIMLEGPLASRRWAFQEDVLARRTISYHKGEIVFECSCNLSCECNGVEYELQSRREGRITLQGSQQPAYVKPFMPAVSCQDLYNDWRRSLAQYTSRNLTKELDIFPAMSGIAMKIAERTKDTFLGGIWKGDAQKGLLWHRVQDDEENLLLHLPANYRAPSFSWASVKGSITYDSVFLDNTSLLGDIRISVLDAQCTIEGLNPTGVVSDGFLRLSGLVQRTTMKGRKLSKGEAAYSWKLLRYSFEWVEHVEFSWFHADSILARTDVLSPSGESIPTVRRKDPAAFETEYSVEWERTPVTCLIIADWVHLREPPVDKNQWSGSTYEYHDRYHLLVLGLSSSAPGAYERLGLLELTFLPAAGAEWLKKAEKAKTKIV
ncbi:hypothetical protein MMC28_008798 [Mycoblastus sanguinarius]|nr:hypothetical protein [Mycoblastus sanguinarius]